MMEVGPFFFARLVLRGLCMGIHKNAVHYPCRVAPNIGHSLAPQYRSLRAKSGKRGRVLEPTRKANPTLVHEACDGVRSLCITTRIRAMGLSVILPIVAALGAGGWIGSVITNWMTARRERAARAVQFRTQQLEQFYGPLLAMHKEIRARSELRVKLQQAIDSQHMEDMLLAGPGKTEEASDAHLPAILINIRDESETFRNILMPRYREVMDVFRDKMWLVEPETREYFEGLIEFVDVWDKILADKLPPPVASAIGHTEQNLQPFYRHLEKMHDRIRSEIE
jgi:hypothetical protein